MSKQPISGLSPEADADANASTDRGVTTSRADGLSADSPVFLPPLRPRRGLLLATSAVLAAWLGFLLFLYFTTVYPHAGRARPASPRPADELIDPADLRPGPDLRPVPGTPRTSPAPATAPAPAGPLGPFGPVPR
jgi:hypothetical protein